MPLSEDFHNYFITQKRPGMRVTGSYELNGKTYTCTGTDCLAFQDYGRGVWNYGAAYWWAGL